MLNFQPHRSNLKKKLDFVLLYSQYVEKIKIKDPMVKIYSLSFHVGEVSDYPNRRFFLFLSCITFSQVKLSSITTVILVTYPINLISLLSFFLPRLILVTSKESVQITAVTWYHWSHLKATITTIVRQVCSTCEAKNSERNIRDGAVDSAI